MISTLVILRLDEQSYFDGILGDRTLVPRVMYLKGCLFYTGEKNQMTLSFVNETSL